MKWTVLAFCAVGCGAKDAPVADTGTSEPVDEWVAPDARGPWAVGTLEDAFTPSHGIELPVQAWFPASETGDEIYKYDSLVSGSAYEDGVPACDSPRPVMVFSHGNSGIRWQSIFLTEHLASQGWVVVAPDHIGNTLFDIDYDRLPEMIFRRPVDVAATFDWLVDVGAAPGGPLEGCVDPAAGYAIAGHSFGGYTTLAVAGAVIDRDAVAAYCVEDDPWLCGDVEAWFEENGGGPVVDLSDDRVWAAMPLAPAGYEVLIGGLDLISVPILIQGGALDELTTLEGQVQPIFNALAGVPRYLSIIEGAGHYGFSDACNYSPALEECEAPYAQADVLHPLIRTTAAAFLQVAMGEERGRDWLPSDDESVAWTAIEQ